MKTPILLIAFACSSFISLFAQEYTPFPLKDARWNTSSSSFSKECYYSFYYDGDTTLQNLKYSKLYYNSICRDFITQTKSGEHHELAGLIREVGKKVYLSQYGRENLIFDFSLQVGDTVPSALLTTLSPNSKFVVVSIDSIKLLDGTYRKKYKAANPLNTDFSNEFIEGIGSLKTFKGIDPISGTLLDKGGDLLCFTVSEKTLYTRSQNASSCPLITPITELDNTVIRLSSNVLSAPVQITWEGEPLTFSILNLVGQELYRAEQRYSPHQMEKGNWASGIYFLKVETQNKQFQVFKLFVP